VVLPDRLAIALVDGEQELPFARAAPENTQVAVQDGRGGVAPDVLQLAEVLAPQFLAAEVVADHAGRAEAGNDPLAVGDRAGRAVGIGVVGGLLLLVLGFLLPEELAVGPVKAQDGAAGALGDGLGEEDAVTPDDGRGVAGGGQRCLPADVLRGAPLQRHVLLGTDAVAVRAAPGGPVAGGGQAGTGEKENEGTQAAVHEESSGSIR